MSDNPEKVEPKVDPVLPNLITPEQLEQMQKSCELALQGKLNPPEVEAQIVAQQKLWATMERFSKRETSDAGSNKR